MPLKSLLEPAAKPVSKTSLKGLIVAPVTSFDDGEVVSLPAFTAHLEFLLESGVDGICVAGTTGEAHTLSSGERTQLFRTAAKVCEGRATVVAGTGATTTREARRLVNLAADCGCSAALVLTPWFEAPSEESLLRYYAEVVEHANLPILLYHNPSRTHVAWQPEGIARVVTALAGSKLMGIKDSFAQVGRVQRLRELVPASFKIFCGAPHQWPEFQRAGTNGSIDGTANLLPAIASQLLAGSGEGREQFAAASRCLEASGNYIALIKATLAKLGHPCGVPRRPFDQADVAEVAALCETLHVPLTAAERTRVSVPVTPPPVPMPLLRNTSVAECIKGALPPVGTPLYRAGDASDRYAHHPCITVHEGTFFAAWSSGVTHEDSPGQIVKYATSADGKTWSEPKDVMARSDAPERWTAAGLWTREDGLYLLCTRYTLARYVDGERTPGVCWEDLATDLYRWNGRVWEALGLFADDYYANEGPRRLRDGRWMTVGVNGRHDAVARISSDATGTRWDRVTLSPRSATRKLTEPSWLTLADGTLRVLLRDDGGSRRIWCCESRDGGRTFSTPVITDLTDARAKFFALQLPASGGELCNALICNPSPGFERKLLALALSDGRGDGAFTRMLPLRFNPLVEPRYSGLHKAPGFEYPNACVERGNLYVIYSVNKENIEVQTVPL